jgi:DeoR family transcriptional regulator of aga operon
MHERSSAARVALVPAQRHARILQVLQGVGAASVQGLAEATGASLSTLRRDLEALEEAGFVERSFGGARLRARAMATLEPGQAVASHIRHDEKVAIGCAAAQAVEPHQAVLFDSSSTVLEAARAVAARGIPLTAITNDLAIAQVIAASPVVKIVVIGGLLRAGSATLYGAPGEAFLAGISADVALVGAHAVTVDGLSEATLEITSIKKAMLRAGRSIRVLADHTKFREASVFRICGLESVHEIITDSGADAETCAMLAERGPQVRRAAPAEQAA